MSKNYYQERNKINISKLSEILRQLPEYCYDFFIAIESNTSTLTRLNYGYDLRIFFTYISKYKIQIKPNLISYSDLEKITTRDIEQFLSYLTCYEIDGVEYTNNEKGKARKLSAIRSLFKYLYAHDQIKHNILTKMSTPKIHQKAIIRLEVDEVAKLINQAERPFDLSAKQQSYNKLTTERDVAILSLFLGTGIRISECVGLNVEDIDLNNNSFKITRKGGNQVILYFSDEVNESLSNWIEKRKEINIEKNHENALFISLQKRRITTRAIENLVKKYSQAVTPLKKISPHKLRSTYGTNLYRETGDIYVVADVLGHKDVNTTKKHYAAISDDIRRNAASKVKLR